MGQQRWKAKVKLPTQTQFRWEILRIDFEMPEGSLMQFKKQMWKIFMY